MNQKKHRIIEFLETREGSFFPVQIADKLKLNRSTIRCYVRELAKDGQICRLEGGRYCSKITYGVMKPLLVHNLRFRVGAAWLRGLGKVEDFDERFGGVHFWVQFGKQRNRITGGIAYDKGLDQAHLLMLLRRFFDVVETRTGHKIDRLREKFVVTTEEWNRDHVGIRLDSRDGINCFTLSEFEDYLTRIYQKEENVVRAETKVSKEMTFDELLEIQNKGSFSFVRDLEIVNRLRGDIQGLTEATKGTNRLLADQSRDIRDVKDVMVKQGEVMERYGEYTEKFGVNVDKHLELTDTLGKESRVRGEGTLKLIATMREESEQRSGQTLKMIAAIEDDSKRRSDETLKLIEALTGVVQEISEERRRPISRPRLGSRKHHLGRRKPPTKKQEPKPKRKRREAGATEKKKRKRKQPKKKGLGARISAWWNRGYE